MGGTLLTAPSGRGKTHALAADIQRRCRDSLSRQICPATMWVCVPNGALVSAFRRELAGLGGAVGVRVGTVSTLCRDILAQAHRYVPALPDPMQHRVLRALIDDLADRGQLPHFRPIIRQPSFVRIVRRAIDELSRYRLSPNDLLGNGSTACCAPNERTSVAFGELATIYDAYDRWLGTHDWTDATHLAELAIGVLRDPMLLSDWALCAFDGFDHFDALQLELIRLLNGRPLEVIVTLTDPGPAAATRLALRRFQRTKARLTPLRLVEKPLSEAALGADPMAPALRHLEEQVLDPAPTARDLGQAISFFSVTDQAAEVREALRWLKGQMLDHGYAPHQVALLARDLSPYRTRLLETAAEFGLPLRLAMAEPLADNPAVAALLQLTALPWQDYPWREVVESWRCPYFDWSLLGTKQNIEPDLPDADRLSLVAHWGQITAGAQAWEEILALLATPATSTDGDDNEDIHERPAGLAAQACAGLLGRWRRFVARLTPSAEATMTEYVGWIEGLIGGDNQEPDPPDALHMWAQASEANNQALCQRDHTALSALKDVLRGLVLAEATVGASEPLDYAMFWRELEGAVRSAGIQPSEQEQDAILASDLHRARGLSFKAAALIGLAEGVLPASPSEDALLPEAVRAELAATYERFEHVTESDEPTLFYEGITRATERLLLVRPRLAPDGAPWQPSPYWEAALAACSATEQAVCAKRAGDVVPVGQVASMQELLHTLAQETTCPLPRMETRWPHLVRGATIWAIRQRGEPAPHQGNLSRLGDELWQRWGSRYMWSPSRLESYGACPFRFFVATALGLEVTEPPREGMDVAQKGTLYHRILERLYRETNSPALEDLLATLETVAARELDAAPAKDGFRPTAWWEVERAEMTQVLRDTVGALYEAADSYAPLRCEARFGIDGQPALHLADEQGSAIRIRGVIDRVDRNTHGAVRVIDYKSSKTQISGRELEEGKRLQIGLYALAAEKALGLGHVASGFYWHVPAAKASWLKLERIPDAQAKVIAYVKQYVAGVRQGDFRPTPPSGGCPSYCPAKSFCWQYQGGRYP